MPGQRVQANAFETCVESPWQWYLASFPSLVRPGYVRECSKAQQQDIYIGHRHRHRQVLYVYL